jgi:hypothetical protein
MLKLHFTLTYSEAGETKNVGATIHCRLAASLLALLQHVTGSVACEKPYPL